MDNPHENNGEQPDGTPKGPFLNNSDDSGLFGQTPPPEQDSGPQPTEAPFVQPGQAAPQPQQPPFAQPGQVPGMGQTPPFGQPSQQPPFGHPSQQPPFGQPGQAPPPGGMGHLGYPAMGASGQPGSPPTGGMPPQYPAVGYGYPKPPSQEHPQAVTILICGIIGLACCAPVGIIAWVMGHKARHEVSQGMYPPSTMVTVGYILGIIGPVLWGLYILVSLLSGLISVV